MTPEPQHHHDSIEFESHLIRRHLQHLSQAFGIKQDDNSGENQQQQPSSQDRHLANLAKFLQTTLNRASMAGRGKRRRTMTGSDGGQASTSVPMTRAASLGERRGTARYRNARGRSPKPSNGQQNWDVSSFCPELEPSVLASSGTGWPTKPSRQRQIRRRLSLDDADEYRMDGTVTIYQNTPAPSGLDLQGELASQPQQVQIPQYAKDLIDDLECFVDCILPRVRIEPIGRHLTRPPPAMVEDEVPLSKNEDEQKVSDDGISQKSFGELSPASSRGHLSTTQGDHTCTPSIFRFACRKTKTVETHPPIPPLPAVRRKASCLELIRRARENTCTAIRASDCPKSRRTIRKMVSSWFRR